LGNTFFDADPPAFASLPEGTLGAVEYLEVARALLEDRKSGRMRHFASLPEYMSRHRNGILWRSVALIYSFSMPQSDIVTLTKSFEREVFVQRDPFVVSLIFQMLLETGVPRFLRASARLLPLLSEGTDTADIARTYAIILEDVGFDPSKSKIVAAEAAGGRAALTTAVLAALAPFGEDDDPDLPVRIHAARNFDLETVLLALAEGVIRPYFFVKIYFEKVLLEAYTGVDLSAGFRKLQLDPTAMYEALSHLSDRTDFSKFEPGRRYFFGDLVD
jgi:hypothetical protein